MNEPRRLRDGSSSELTRALLRAGAEEQPSSAAIARAAAAATAATAVTAVTSAATAGATTKVAAASTLAKWTTVVVVGVAATSGAYVYERARSPAQTAPAISAPSVASSAPAQTSAVSPIVAVPNTEAPPSASAAPSSPKAPAPRPSASNLRVQLDELAHITQLLQSGDANKTLAALDRFDHDFPGHSLGQETMRLRIEALLKKGDRAAARELAKKFLTRYPASPYAARVRSLLRDSTNP